MSTKTKQTSVDLIASGYEWTCPKCGKFNCEIEAVETVVCRLSEPDSDMEMGCGAVFEVGQVLHAGAYDNF